MSQTDPIVVLGGRPIRDAADRVRRFCGLPWSGGEPETWDFLFFDGIENDGTLDRVDVLAVGPLLAGLRREHLAFFLEHRDDIDAWLARISVTADLAAADDELLARLDHVATWPDSPGIAFLSKLLHRARPHAVPLVDKHIVDWYRPLTGERRPQYAWSLLLRALSSDLARNAEALQAISDEIHAETGIRLSHLRTIDIINWMGYRP